MHCLGCRLALILFTHSGACSSAQIAKPSPSGGRINIQSRRVQCAPPTNLVVTVNNNDGNDGWIRLQVQVQMESRLFASVPSAAGFRALHACSQQ